MKKRNSRVFISLLLIAIMIAASCFVPGIGVHAATSMKIQFYNQDRTSSSNQLYTNFKIVNTGTTAIDLTKVKLRYYFSDSAAVDSLNSYIDHYSVTNNSNDILTSYDSISGDAGANRYLEIGFRNGNLTAGGEAVVSCRTAKSDWTNFYQDDDYSFNKTAENYTDWSKVTGYILDSLAWGTEPFTSSPSITATNTPTSSPTPTPTEKKIDMLALRNSLKVIITNSDIGMVAFPKGDWGVSRYMDNSYIENLFNGYPYDNNYVQRFQNNFYIQFEFDSPESITSVVTMIENNSTQNWKLEAADSAEDLKNKSNTYIAAVQTTSNWGKVSFTNPISRKIWKLTTQNTDASNPNKVVKLPDIEFYTNDSIAPVIPTAAPSASVIDARTVKLVWQAAQAGTDLIGYEVFQSLNGTSGWNSIGKVVGTSFTDTLLAPETKYYYKVRAIDKCGNTSNFTDVVSATTSNTMPLKKDYNVLVLYYDPEIPAGTYDYQYLENKTQLENDTTGTVQPIYSTRSVTIPQNPATGENYRFSEYYNSQYNQSNLQNKLNEYKKYFSEVSGGSVNFNFTEIRTLGVNPANDPDWLNLNILIEYEERKKAGNLYDYAKVYDVTRHGGANYHKVYKDENILDLVESGSIDFVWEVASYDNGGFNEASMAGRGATFVNGLTLPDLYSSLKFITYIGFSYECMGHMTECMIDRMSAYWPKTNEAYILNTHDVNSPSWGVTKRSFSDGNYFMLTDSFNSYTPLGVAPGNAQAGNMHNPPNSCRNYGWAATTHDFTRNYDDKGWYTSGGEWSLNTGAGNYNVSVTGMEGANSIFYGVDCGNNIDFICSDMNYSAKVRFDSIGNGSTAGLIFRVTKYNGTPGSFNGYYACLDKENQKVSLYQYSTESGRLNPVKAESSMSIASGIKYDLKVTTDRNNIKVYVNDDLKLDYTHTEYDEAETYKYLGAVGLRAESAAVTFDDVLIDNTAYTYADNWYQYPNYPNSTSSPRKITFSELESSEEGFHRWWFDRIPKNPGVNSKGIMNNWWGYIMDYNHFDQYINDYLKPDSPKKLTITDAAVPPVSGLVVEDRGASFIKLSWKNPGNTPAYSHVQVYQKQGSEPYSLIKITQENSYIARGLNPNTTYSFMVCTVDSNGNLSLPSERRITTFSDYLKYEINSRTATLTGTNPDTGTFQACFDENTTTGITTASINPAYVQINFKTSNTIEKARVFLGEPGDPTDINSWYLEAADSEYDLQNKTGSYKMVIPEQVGVMGDWDEAISINIVNRKIWRFNIKRTTGGNNVTIKELELY
jgi:hypothetical protein